VRLWVNDYVDAKTGRDAGTLLSISANLHILLSESPDYKPRHSIGVCCSKCRNPIAGRNTYPAPEDSRVLACRCVTVLFGASSFSHDWIVEHWNEWRRIKQVAENQLAAKDN
jgi:hypothetical protein